MNVVIFGASGGIGKEAVKYALENGHSVTAYLRNPGRLDITHNNLRIIKGEINDRNSMYEAVKGQDAVIWCVGIPMKRKYEKMESLEGHKVLLESMKRAEVKRLIDWGTPSVHFEKDKKSFITVVPGIIAGIALKKSKQEMTAIGELIKASDTDWTMVRFMAPKDTPFTGNVKTGFGETKMKFAVSRKDIAYFMVKQLTDEKYLYSMPIIGS